MSKSNDKYTKFNWQLNVLITQDLYSTCNQSEGIVLPRSNDYVYICLLVLIKIKTFGWHIQKSDVILKTICCQYG